MLTIDSCVARYALYDIRNSLNSFGNFPPFSCNNWPKHQQLIQT